MLRVAAVAGRRVPHRLLAAVAGLSDREQTEALRVAVAHQLLVTRPGEDGYEFRHALLQEAVYTSLLPGERARVHATLATAIAAHPDWAGGTAATVAAELAYHWQAAGELERALPATIEAGVQAGLTFAFAEARRFYEHALELWARRAGRSAPSPMRSSRPMSTARSPSYATPGASPRSRPMSTGSAGLPCSWPCSWS